MADDESGSAGGHASLSEHVDNPLVFLLLIAAFVWGTGCVGRYIGNTTNKPGVTAFFGG